MYEPENTSFNFRFIGADGLKIPIQLQNQNIQLQHPYHHHVQQAGTLL